MIDDKGDYEIHDAELLAIVESFYHWRHYPEQPYHIVEVLTNNSKLCVFTSTNKLTQRQVRLALNRSVFDFRLVYRNKTFNHVDGLSS